MTPRHLVAYHGNRYIDHFRRDLEEIADHGFTGIVHCATEADLEWGMGRLGELFAATRDAGLECWADPWGVGGVFGGEAHSGFLGRHPDALQRASDGRALPHACLRQPSFLEFVERWVDAIANAGAQAIFWDEPHVGNPGAGAWACACAECTDALETEAAPPEITEEVLDFRVATALGFLRHVSTHAARVGLRSSVCLYPVGPDRARLLGLPPIEDVAALETVDDVAVDPYPVFVVFQGRGYDDFDAERLVGRWADRLLAISRDHGVSVHIWVQGFALPTGYEHLVEECARVARAHGVHDLAFWSYRASENTSQIAPGDPAAVWGAARRAFRLP